MSSKKTTLQFSEQRENQNRLLFKALLLRWITLEIFQKGNFNLIQVISMNVQKLVLHSQILPKFGVGLDSIKAISCEAET